MFDGASKGNPGKAGAGWHLSEERRGVLAVGWQYLGDRETNNVAEYHAMLLGLQHVLDNHATEAGWLEIHGDSKLVIRQMLGQWEVKAPHLLPLRERGRELVRALRSKSIIVVLDHVPREENAAADYLSNVAVKQRNKEHRVVTSSQAVVSGVLPVDKKSVQALAERYPESPEF